MALLKTLGSSLAESLWALLLVVVIFSTSSVLLERYYRTGITTNKLRIRNLASSEWYFLYHQKENLMHSEDTRKRYFIKSKVELTKTKIEILDKRNNQNYPYVFSNN